MSTRSNSSNGGSAVSTGETPVVRPPFDSIEDTSVVLQATIFFAISPIDSTIGWSSDLTLVHMLTDLVKASGGVVATDADGILAATTGTALQALVLAVRAVRLATSYARYRPEGLGSFAVAILSGPEAEVSPDSALRWALSEVGASGRILLAGEALNQLRNVPGLQAKKVPALGGQKLDIHELVLPAITPDTRTAEIVAMQPGTTTPREQMAAAPTREMPALFPQELEIEEPVSAGRSKLLIGGGLAAALVIGGVLAMTMTSKKAPGTPVSSAPAPVAVPAQVPLPTASQPAAPSPEVPVAIRPIRAAVEPAPPPKSRGRVAEDAATAPVPKAESDGPHGGFTADQLKAILDKADKLTANGKYEEAIRNYNVVLAADPGNSRAKAGKERAVTNMNMP